MDVKTIMTNLEEQSLGLERLVFTADMYQERYGAKYLGWPVVRYLYTRIRVLKIIYLRVCYLLITPNHAKVPELINNYTKLPRLVNIDMDQIIIKHHSNQGMLFLLKVTPYF